jgi:hypothetical protein
LRSSFATHRTFCHVWRLVWLSQLDSGVAANMEKAEFRVTAKHKHRTGPTAKGCPAQHVKSSS